MTLPDERYRAVVQTRRFLLDLCNTQHTPRIPKLIRDTARSLLRHYPTDYDMKSVEHYAPQYFEERMEPLYRMVKAHSIDKENETKD
jgi:hypothetical protein